jgi:hypothetical protein
MPDAFEHPIREQRELGIGPGLWARRVTMTLLALVGVLALADRFGQVPSTSSAAGPGASLSLSAPDVVRGGLFFQSRVKIRVARAITRPRLVLGDGWVEGMQFNSTEPAPSSEAGRDGHVVLSWNQLEAGDVLQVWFQFEVDPTNLGSHDYSLELDDGDTPLARISRRIRVMP